MARSRGDANRSETRLCRLLIEGPALERRGVHRFAQDLGVKPSAVSILLALYQDGPQSLRALRDQLAFVESTVSEGLGALVGLHLANDGLRRSPTGRWTRVASPTASGKLAAQRFLERTAAEERARANRKRAAARRRLTRG